MIVQYWVQEDVSEGGGCTRGYRCYRVWPTWGTWYALLTPWRTCFWHGDKLTLRQGTELLNFAAAVALCLCLCCVLRVLRKSVDLTRVVRHRSRRSARSRRRVSKAKTSTQIKEQKLSF